MAGIDNFRLSADESLNMVSRMFLGFDDPVDVVLVCSIHDISLTVVFHQLMVRFLGFLVEFDAHYQQLEIADFFDHCLDLAHANLRTVVRPVH